MKNKILIFIFALFGLGLLWAAYDDYFGEPERIKNCLPNVKSGDIFSVVPAGIPGRRNVYEYQKIVEVEDGKITLRRSRIISSDIRNNEIKDADFFRDDEETISLDEFKAQNFKDAFCE